ncbi:MAG: imidazoleglycerol-phosphate dehydratase HisB [Spirochaetes bacterium]|nr:imidazoleglycerol-phosphate dehydratase HisB [Spirochaetota bacterium]
MRKSEIKRKTKETDIELVLKLDSAEESSVSTGIGFFDHMIHSFMKHGRMSVNLTCRGDLQVDDHHTVEDVGICLGLAFNEALGDKKGIRRFGFASVPMDESLCQVSADLSGRPFFVMKGDMPAGYIKDYNNEMTNEFWYAFATNAKINLHINILYGDNSHHINEAVYKAAGAALHSAFTIDSAVKDVIPSTKGVI